MNKAFSSLLIASALGFSSLYAAPVKWAAEATDVQVKLAGASSNPAPIPAVGIVPVAGPYDRAGLGNGAPGEKNKQWAMINIPIEIRAVGNAPIYSDSSSSSKKKLPARFVKELKVKAYVLFKKSNNALDSKDKVNMNTENYYLLQKEITYVNIPMGSDPQTGDGFRDLPTGGGAAKMNVGLFLSPSSVLKLTGYDDTKELDPAKALRIAGVAVVASVGGLPTRPIEKQGDARLTTNELISSIFDKKLKDVKEKKWWSDSTASRYSKTDAELLCISETPFAPFYAAAYPATKPLYGAPVVTQESSSTTTTTTTTTESDSTSTQTRESDDTKTADSEA